MSTKRFLVEFIVILLVYICCVVVSSSSVRSIPDGATKIALALLPVIPMIAMAVSIIRRLNSMDELGRKIQLEALAVALYVPPSPPSATVSWKPPACRACRPSWSGQSWAASGVWRRSLAQGVINE